MNTSPPYLTKYEALAVACWFKVPYTTALMMPQRHAADLLSVIPSDHRPGPMFTFNGKPVSVKQLRHRLRTVLGRSFVESRDSSRRRLLARFMKADRSIGLETAIQAGPRWPKVTVAASWDAWGYTEWSDGIRTFLPPLNIHPDTLFGLILPVARHYELPVQSVLDMSYTDLERHVAAMRASA